MDELTELEGGGLSPGTTTLSSSVAQVPIRARRVRGLGGALDSVDVVSRLNAAFVYIYGKKCKQITQFFRIEKT